MKNVIKIAICLAVTMFTAGNLSAQMMAARQVAPAAEKKIALKVSADKVWEYISEPANYKKMSGVKEFTCEEKALNAKIELTTKAGKKRSQYISVIDYDNFKICYFVTKSDYKTDGEWVYSFEVRPLGNKKCEFVVAAYAGLDTPDPEFKKSITQEFNDIITGVSKKFK